MRKPSSRRQSPPLNEEEWRLLLDFYLRHGRGSYSWDDLEALSIRVRACRPTEELAATWRSADGLRRQLAVFKVLEVPEATADTKTATIAREVWRRYAKIPDALSDAIAADIVLRQKPSRGPSPAFGEVLHHRADGPTALYLFVLQGAAALYGDARLQGRAVIKVGRSNDVQRRATELNSGIPPGAGLAWRLFSVREFESALLAHRREQQLLADLHSRGDSLGGEFALVKTNLLERLI